MEQVKTYSVGLSLIYRAAAAIAGLSVAASLASLAATTWWVFDLLAHFRVQYIVLQAALLVVFIVGRRLFWIPPLAVSILLNALPLMPYFPATKDGIDGQPLTVLNMNVSAERDNADQVSARIDVTSPDLVLVVEATPRLAVTLENQLERYPYQFVHPATDPFGIALLSRYPLLSAEPVTLGTTQAIDAIVNTPAGPLNFLGVHLLPPVSAAWSKIRNEQLAGLASLSRSFSAPTVVCGDFNVSPYSPYFKGFLKTSGLADARRGRGLAHSWPTFMPLFGIPIDVCTVSRGIEVADVKRLDPIDSDHYPILFELMLENNDE